MQAIPVILIVLASLVTVGVVSSRLAYMLGERHARQSGVEMANLNELGRQLLRSQLSVDDLCELIYWQAGQIVPAAFFQLGLFDGDAYQVKVWVRDGERLPETVFPEGGVKGIIGWVRETGQALVVRDFEAERDRLPAFPDFELESPPRSGLFVPLIAGHSTLGVMSIQCREVARFDEGHLRLLTALANQVAWAIRNAQLYEHAQARAERLNLIGQVSAQISAIQPLSALFRQIVTLTREMFDYYCVTIFVNDDGQLRMGASTSDVAAQRAPEIGLGEGMIGWALQEAQTALANNVADDPRYRWLEILPETKSEISLPLKVEERVVGVLDVQSDRVGAFSSEHVALLETLAAQIALAIEQAQTYDAERQLAQRLEALMQVNQAVVSILELDELLDKVADLIADTFGYERVHIFLRIGHSLVFRAGVGPHSVRWLVDELIYDLDDDGLIPKAARTGEPELVGDVTQTQDYRPGKGVEDTRSEMVIPVKMVDRVMGVLDLQSEEVDAFSEEDFLLMQSLADTVAVAIRNASLYVTERRRRDLAETLREISATLVSDLDLDRVLTGILEGLGHVVTLETAAILLFDDDRADLTVVATTGEELEGVVGHRVVLEELERDDAIGLEEAVSRAYHELLSMPVGHTCMTAPLIVDGNLIGYLIADQHGLGQYSLHDQEIVSAFANQVAVAINNARLYAGQQAEAWVTTALLQVAEAVNAQIDVTEAMGTIARLTALLAGVTKCVILRWEPETRLYSANAQYGLPPEQSAGVAAATLLADTYPFLDLLSVADRPIGAGEGYQLAVPEPLAEALAAPAILGFPLRAKQELVGLLVVDDPRRGYSLDPRLMNILTGVAHQAATALESATLQASAAERDRLEQELHVARQIQASLIPESPPQLEGWQIAAAWRAARQVSGDFYDFIPLPNGLWGLVIADVADKGIPAALFMAMCRTLLRAAAISRLSPAETLMRVNRLLLNDSRSDLFVTVFYAVWVPVTGELVYASAGHNPAILVRKGGCEVKELRTKGIALGVLPDIQIEQRRVTLMPGDVLVAYTDGVTEAMQLDYTEWGLERFVETLKRVGDRPAQVVMDEVLAAIDEFVGDAPQSDDLTIWLLQREEDGSQ